MPGHFDRTYPFYFIWFFGKLLYHQTSSCSCSILRRQGLRSCWGSQGLYSLCLWTCISLSVHSRLRLSHLPCWGWRVKPVGGRGFVFLTSLLVILSLLFLRHGWGNSCMNKIFFFFEILTTVVALVSIDKSDGRVTDGITLGWMSLTVPLILTSTKWSCSDPLLKRHICAQGACFQVHFARDIVWAGNRDLLVERTCFIQKHLLYLAF